MSRPPALPVTAAADGWPLIRLEAWLIRPALVLRYRRKVRSRVFFLLPPPGFSGSARLGVIDGQTREEAFQRWTGGRTEAAADPTGALDGCYAALAQERDGPAAAEPGARWPLAFTASLGPQGEVRVDLLLEVEPAGAEGGEPVRLAGALDLPPVRWEPARLQVLPLIDSDDPEVLEAGIRAARRDAALRFSAPADLATAFAGSRALSAARKLHGLGRIDWVWTGAAWEAETLAALAMPHPPLAAVTTVASEEITRREIAARAPRGLLRLPPPGATACAPRTDPREEWPMLDAGGRLTWTAAAWIDAGAFAPARAPFLIALVDRALRAGRPQPAPPGLLAWLPVRIEQAAQWRTLSTGLRRWNRGHALPQLIATTAGDCVALAGAGEGEGT